MRVIRFLADWNDVDGGGNSFVKYQKGRCYAVDEETRRCASQGAAEEIDASDEPEVAARSAAKAAEKAEAAVAAADAAAADAEAASDAARITDDLAAQVNAEQIAAAQSPEAATPGAGPLPGASSGAAASEAQ